MWPPQYFAFFLIKNLHSFAKIEEQELISRIEFFIQKLKNINMEAKNLSELTDQELLDEGKKRKEIFGAGFGVFGATIPYGVYTTFKDGLGIYTFLPFLLTAILASYYPKYKAAKAEIASRKLG